MMVALPSFNYYTLLFSVLSFFFSRRRIRIFDNDGGKSGNLSAASGQGREGTGWGPRGGPRGGGGGENHVRRVPRISLPAENCSFCQVTDVTPASRSGRTFPVAEREPGRTTEREEIKFNRNLHREDRRGTLGRPAAGKKYD